MKPRLILASNSPRRRDLMNEAGLDFEVIPARVDEIEDASLGIRRLVLENAKLKAAAVAKEEPDAIVIGADTLVALGDLPLGKPDDLEHGFRMLKSLIGKSHTVGTGVCLMNHQKAERAFLVETQVTFRPLNDAQIREYLGMIDPLDKAGSYAAQDHGEFIIERTEGSWTNVVGLPMEELLAELSRFTESL